MNNLANQYYAKAYDAYPYEVAEAMEALGYALSYDENHAGAHCLMGKLCMIQLKQFEEAIYHFECVIASDPQTVDVYPWYSLLLIRTGDNEKALRLIKYAEGIKGIDQIWMKQIRALVFESQDDLQQAKKLLKGAMKSSLSNDYSRFIESELERVNKKLKKTRKKKSKSSGSKKKKKGKKK